MPAIHVPHWTPLLAGRPPLLHNRRASRSSHCAACRPQYTWRRYNDLLARANDPVYELIDKEGQPSQQALWQMRSSGAGKSSKNLLVRTKTGLKGNASYRRRRASRAPSAAPDILTQEKLDAITAMLKDVQERVEGLEAKTASSHRK